MAEFEKCPRASRRNGQKRGRLSGRQKIIIAAAMTACAAAVFTFAWKSLFIRPELPDRRQEEPGGTGTQEPERQEPYIDYGDGVKPLAEGERKSRDFYTVLILGRDTGGGGNTDTMLLASYDVTNQKAAVMSIPRDTMVNVSWDVKKINSVYNWYGGDERGIQALYKEVAQLVGFEPDYRVVVEWEAVGKVVDAIGGVEFDVPYRMDYHDHYQNLVIDQEAGLRRLTGEDAMQVIRWRKNDPGSPYGYNTGGIGDSGRMELQQDFLKAVIREMLQPKNVLNIGKIAKVFSESVQTDLKFQNILWFGKQAVSGGLKVEDVTFFTMPYRGASAYSYTYSKQMGQDFYLSYVVPRQSQLLEMVNNHLSPFQKTFTLQDLDIMFVNADGSIGSTSGHVEDAQAAQPPKLISSGGDEKTYWLDPYGFYVDPDTGEMVYYTDTNGNVIHIESGEIVDPPPKSTTDRGGASGGGTEDPAPPSGGGTETPGGESPGTENPGTEDPGAEAPDPSQDPPGPLIDPVTGEPYPLWEP